VVLGNKERLYAWKQQLHQMVKRNKAALHGGTQQSKCKQRQADAEDLGVKQQMVHERRKKVPGGN
jgi:hypothetical protein